MRRMFAVLFSAMVALPSLASADPIVVEVNAATVTSSQADTATLFHLWRTVPGGSAVDGFIASGRVNPLTFLFGQCGPCRSGDFYTPSVNLAPLFGEMHVIVGPSDNPTHRWVDAQVTGSMLFATTGPGLFLPDNPTELYTLQFVTRLDGQVSGWVGGEEVVRIAPFRLPGTTLVQFRTTPLDGGGYQFTPQFVQFTSTDPVPEPATLFLLGSGLAGLALRRRR